MRRRKRGYRRLNEKELRERFLTKSGMVKRFIDGNYHTDQRVGYCWNDTHRGFLSKSLMKKHKCVEKGCTYLQIYKPKEETTDERPEAAG